MKDFFVSYDDTKALITFPSSIVNNALDQIFKKTKFTIDLESVHDLFGEINFESEKVKSRLQFLINFFGAKSEVIWIEKHERILVFEDIKTEYL